MDPVLQNMSFLSSLDHHMIEGLSSYGDWIYVVLFAIIFAETGLVIFPFLPGDSLLFAAGTLASSGQAHIAVVCFALWLAALLGNTTNYWIGRWVGKRVFKWEDSRFFNKRTFERTHAYYRKHGGKTIIIARFIPFARTFAPFVAGVVRMDYRHFLIKDVVGASLWVLSLTLGGFWFGKLPFVRDNLGVIVVFLLALSFIPIIAALWRLRAGLPRSPSAPPDGP